MLYTTCLPARLLSRYNTSISKFYYHILRQGHNALTSSKLRQTREWIKKKRTIFLFLFFHPRLYNQSTIAISMPCYCYSYRFEQLSAVRSIKKNKKRKRIIQFSVTLHKYNLLQLFDQQFFCFIFNICPHDSHAVHTRDVPHYEYIVYCIVLRCIAENDAVRPVQMIKTQCHYRICSIVTATLSNSKCC